MSLSVNTNASALLALQNLNATNSNLSGVQGRISTGLKVATAKDDASTWAIAQKQRSDTMSLDAVKSSLDRATSIADVASSAGASVSDLLNQIKQKLTAAQDTSLQAGDRALINNDFKSLMGQIKDIVNNAEFDGANILNGSLTSDIKFLANADATNFVTLGVRNLSLGGSIITLGATDSISSATQAASLMVKVEASITNVNSALGALGSQAKAIEGHNTFVSKLSDVLTTGIGNLVDADMAKESARLQALQVQQQLGVQALSIANAAPQSILSLFKG